MFTQFMLDVKSVQTRDIFNTYIYKTDDTVADIQAAGYFIDSRFSGTDGWDGGKIEARCSDGYAEGFVDEATGTFTLSISG